MQTYQNMKDSGVAYIGEIPSDWSMLRASVLFREMKQANTDSVSSTPVQFKLGEIIEKKIEVDDRVREEIRRYTLIDQNNIMVNGLNLNYDFMTQRVAIVKSPGCITPAYIAMSVRSKFLPMYACYLLKALDGQKVLNGWGTGIRLTLNFSEFKKYYLPTPSLEVQRRIVDYLDGETSKIDNLIHKQERLLEILEEKRHAVIYHFVARGLNPHTELKETDIKWLGKVPSHWALYRAKYLFRKSQEKPLEADGVVTAFRDGEVILRTLRRTEGFTFADKEIGYQHVSKGDLVIHAMDGFAGAIGVSKSDGKMSPVCSICKPIDSAKVNTEYFAQLVRSMAKSDWLTAIAKGIRERSTDFRWGDFANMEFPLPPYEEQVAIIEAIKYEESKADEMKAKIIEQISLLKERRNSLISNVVTGKIKV